MSATLRRRADSVTKPPPADPTVKTKQQTAKERKFSQLWGSMCGCGAGIISLLVLVLIVGLATFVFCLLGFLYTHRSLSIECNDNNSATFDYMSFGSCVNSFIGDGVACDDVCIVAGTGYGTMSTGCCPLCTGQCKGSCVSPRNETGNFYYYPVDDATCPEIEWSAMLLENSTASIMAPVCYMDVCSYVVTWPTTLYYAIQATANGGQDDLCMGFIDSSFSMRSCITARAGLAGCTYTFTCAPYRTDVLLTGAYYQNPN
jgi:hypothetical protein